MLEFLPKDWRDAHLVGRMDFGQGPTPVALKDGLVFDLSALAPTVAQLLDKHASRFEGTVIGAVEELDVQPSWSNKRGRHRLLAPIDLQCVKAAGVTFAVFGDGAGDRGAGRGVPGKAQAIREELASRVGTESEECVPGSPEAARLKDALIADGLWSQYLEVAIGPDAEIFTKAPPLSSVGWGD